MNHMNENSRTQSPSHFLCRPFGGVDAMMLRLLVLYLVGTFVV